MLWAQTILCIPINVGKMVANEQPEGCAEEEDGVEERCLEIEIFCGIMKNQCKMTFSGGKFSIINF